MFEYDRISAAEVYWYLNTGPGAYRKLFGNSTNANSTMNETIETVNFDETASTVDLDSTLHAEADESPGPVADQEAVTVPRRQEARIFDSRRRGEHPKRGPNLDAGSSPRDQEPRKKTSGVIEEEGEKKGLSKGQRAKKRKEEYQKKEQEKIRKLEEKLKEVEQDRTSSYTQKHSRV